MRPLSPSMLSSASLAALLLAFACAPDLGNLPVDDDDAIDDDDATDDDDVVWDDDDDDDDIWDACLATGSGVVWIEHDVPERLLGEWISGEVQADGELLTVTDEAGLAYSVFVSNPEMLWGLTGPGRVMVWADSPNGWNTPYGVAAEVGGLRALVATETNPPIAVTEAFGIAVQTLPDACGEPIDTDCGPQGALPLEVTFFDGDIAQVAQVMPGDGTWLGGYWFQATTGVHTPEPRCPDMVQQSWSYAMWVPEWDG